MNADTDKYKYTSYVIGFDWCSEFSLPDGCYGKNIIIFGADMSSSVPVDNRGKGILILAKGPKKRIRLYYIKSRRKISY